MTTLREIIEAVDFNDTNIQTSPDWEKLASVFDIYEFFWSEDIRLKVYHVKTWLCTDTWVGWEAYFLDGKFVCISSQSARKSDKDFEFVSQEIAKKVESYIRSLAKKENNTTYNILDLDMEFSERYSIEYNSGILHKTAWLKDEKVSILKTRYPHNSKNYFHIVLIKFSNGKKVEIDCRDLLFDYNSLN
jgi:hypothetical protein